MNSKEFVQVLRALAESVEFAGDASSAKQLRKLAEIFDSEPESSLNRTLARRLRSSLSIEDSQMIQRALQHLGLFRRASNEIARKSDLESLDAAIQGLNDNERPARRNGRPQTSTPKSEAVESQLARTYLKRLSEAGGDREEGEKILADMKQNKSLDVAQLNWLVQQFAGGSTTYPTRPKAIGQIGKRLDTIARRAEKSGEISRLTDGN